MIVANQATTTKKENSAIAQYREKYARHILDTLKPIAYKLFWARGWDVYIGQFEVSGLERCAFRSKETDRMELITEVSEDFSMSHIYRIMKDNYSQEGTKISEFTPITIMTEAHLKEDKEKDEYLTQLNFYLRPGLRYDQIMLVRLKRDNLDYLLEKLLYISDEVKLKTRPFSVTPKI